jgi:hypothetical protein
MRVRDVGRRRVFVALLTPIAAVAVAKPAILLGHSGGSTPKLELAIKSTRGMAAAAPVVNFKRLAGHNVQGARVLMGKEHDALPERWQQRQELLERAHPARRVRRAGARRATRFRIEPSASLPSPALRASFNAVDDNNAFIPPDTEGAPGPDKLLVTVNGTVHVQQKSDGSVLSTQTLDNFFSHISGVGTVFDPHVLYDPYANRWIVVAVSNGRLPNSDLLLAVSQTTDPAGNWNEYAVDVDAADLLWGDYPTVGFNKNWIAVSLNTYTNSDLPTCGIGLEASKFCGTQTYVFDKAKAYAGPGAGGGAYQLFERPYPTYDDFTLSPTAMYDPNAADMYLAEDYDGTGNFSSLPLRLFKISGPAGSATMTRLPDPAGAPLTALGSWSDVSGAASAFAPQLGSTQKIDNGDARLSQCVYRNASIWCANTVFLPTALPTHSAVQWYKIDPATSTPAILQAGRINDVTGAQLFAFPSIAVNKYNNALLGFSRFDSNQYASADYAYRSCADVANTFRDEASFKSGAGAYFKTYGGVLNRWGDYSGTWVDPSDDTSMWTIQEYAKAFTGVPTTTVAGTWGTWWGKLAAQTHGAVTAPSPTSSDHTPGSSSTNPVVNVTWTTPDDCTVSYVYKWSTSATDTPNPVTDGTLSGNAVGLASPTLAAGSSWWLHLEALDGGGNASSIVHLGPFPIASPPPPPPPPTTPPPPASPPALKRPPAKVALCYRRHTVRVTKAAATKLRKHGAKLGACKKAKKRR